MIYEEITQQGISRYPMKEAGCDWCEKRSGLSLPGDGMMPLPPGWTTHLDAPDNGHRVMRYRCAECAELHKREETPNDPKLSDRDPRARA